MLDVNCLGVASVERIKLELAGLIDKNVGEADAVVHAEGSVHHGDRSGWGLYARIRCKVVAEQSRTCRSTTSGMRMQLLLQLQL